MISSIASRRCAQLLVAVALVAAGCGPVDGDAASRSAEVQSDSVPALGVEAVRSATTLPVDRTPEELERRDDLIGDLYVPSERSQLLGGREFREAGTYYAIWLEQHGASGVTLVLGRLSDGYGGPAWPFNAEWEVLDARQVPELPPSQEWAFAGGCSVDEVSRRDVVGVIPHTEAGWEPLPVSQAWVADIEEKAFRPMPRRGVVCQALREGG